MRDLWRGKVKSYLVKSYYLTLIFNTKFYYNYRSIKEKDYGLKEEKERVVSNSCYKNKRGETKMKKVKMEKVNKLNQDEAMELEFYYTLGLNLTSMIPFMKRSYKELKQAMLDYNICPKYTAKHSK